MVCDYIEFKRIGTLKYIAMPGGDKATWEPFRMAISYLRSIYGDEIPKRFLERWGKAKVSLILKMIKEGVNSPLTSSAGRLFDAVAALIGIRDIVDHEAQAAVELEMIASLDEKNRYEFGISMQGDLFIIDPNPMILGILKDIERPKPPSIISAKFHNTVVTFTIELCKKIREREGIEKVALSGGVFQNRYLLERMREEFEREGFSMVLPSSIPPNDGGISLGQAVIAGRRKCVLESQQK
jgi:hydrogenase maturation protein HypF